MPHHQSSSEADSGDLHDRGGGTTAPSEDSAPTDGGAIRRTLTVRVPAKINPYLRVLGRRADGFHEIETVMVAISLFDELRITTRADGEAQTALSCDDPEIPADASNLVWRAVELMRESASRTDSVSVALSKTIPAGGGLGGGSADAAATLWALCELWHLPHTTNELAELGAQLGSDVPFFFFGPAAVCRGRGEQVEPFVSTRSQWVVLYVPPFGCDTATVYRASARRLNSSAADEKIQLVFAQRLGTPHFGNACANDLEVAAVSSYPALSTVYEFTNAISCAHRMLTGSGSTIVFYADSEHDARRVERQLSDVALGRAIIARSLVDGEAVFKVR